MTSIALVVIFGAIMAYSWEVMRYEQNENN